jgi:hypothetical protein
MVLARAGPGPGPLQSKARAWATAEQANKQASCIMDEQKVAVHPGERIPGSSSLVVLAGRAAPSVGRAAILIYILRPIESPVALYLVASIHPSCA